MSSFGLDQFDLTAQNELYKKVDGSGSLYSIIKVTSANPEDDLREYRFNFGNMNHEVVERDASLWVYVQRNAKFVTISRPGYAIVDRYDLQTTIEAGRTYTMQFSTAPKQVYTLMVMFTVVPTDSRATVMVKPVASGAIDDVVGITDERGFAAKSLPFGSYSYRVVAEGYYPVDGHFTLGDQSKTHEEKVTLKPRFATITLRGSDYEPGHSSEEGHLHPTRQHWRGPGLYSDEQRQDRDVQDEGGGCRQLRHGVYFWG